MSKELAPKFDPSIMEMTAMIDIGSGPEEVSVADIVLGKKAKNLDKKEKGALVLRITGMKGTKKKYGSEAERKAAQAARAKAKREKEREELEKVGLAPRRRGPKRTEEQDKAYRQNYAKQAYQQRKNMEESMVKDNFSMASKYLGAGKAERIKSRMQKEGRWKTK